MSYLGKSRDLETYDISSYRRPLTVSIDDDPFSRSRMTSERRSYLQTSPKRSFEDNLLTEHGKSKSMQWDVYNLESKVASREARLLELENELRHYHEMEAKQTKTVKQLREALEVSENQAAELSSSNAKTQSVITNLQSDNRQLQERIGELESRMRRHMDERDSVNHSAMQCERNYEELRHLLSRALFPMDSYHEGRSHEQIIKKLNDHFEELPKLHSKLSKVEDVLSAAEDESSASRETIKRLYDEIDRMKKHATNADLIREEKDMAVRKQKQLEEEVQKMEERIAYVQQKYESAQNELRTNQLKLSEFDLTTRRHTLSAQASSLEFKAFKDTIAALLSDGFASIEPNEESIKAKIRHLASNKQDVEKVSKHLEDKLKELSKQLEEQAHLHKTAVQRARKSEEELERFKDKLKSAHGEISATDILNSELKTEKQKYLDFLEQLAHVMKMDSIVKELGMELNGDSLLARAEQLVNTEHELLGKKNSQTVTMQRQLKEAKRQLDSKELHLDVLRKKLASTENENTLKAEKDWQELVDKNHRMKKHIDKLEGHLSETKRAVSSMAEDSQDYEGLKATCEDQQKTLLEFEKRVAELEQIRTKQARKIASLSSDMERGKVDEHHGLRMAESTAQSLSNELQKVKQRLDEVVKREKQLLDLRQVIARMLGLNIDTLAVADYEIITRLEKIIETQHELALATKKMDTDFRHSATARHRSQHSAGRYSPDEFKRAHFGTAEHQKKSITSGHTRYQQPQLSYSGSKSPVANRWK